jgi:hypothetical protein
MVYLLFWSIILYIILRSMFWFINGLFQKTEIGVYHQLASLSLEWTSNAHGCFVAVFLMVM